MKSCGEGLLITNGKIVTWERPNRILEGYAIRIVDEVIERIDQQKKLVEEYPDDKLLDADGQYVMPGNICAHTHFYGAFSRGMVIPGRPAKDFPEILQKLWWPLDKALDLEGVKYSALVCMVDAIRHGTTTLIDHHASQNAIEGSLDVIEGAEKLSELRIATCYETTNRDGNTKTKQAIDENIRFYQKLKRNPSHLVAANFGMHASLTLDDTTLAACREALPDGVGFHLHAAEHQSDQFDSLEKSGMRVIDRLEKFGILGERTILAHCVHVDAKEIEILAQTGTWVTHQPRSNMNNAVGMADIESLLRAGVRLGMGNDGFSNAMWEEWKTAYLAQKLWNRDPRRGSGLDVTEMAIYQNANLATILFGQKIGVISPGAQADLIFVDYHPFTPMTPENLPWHILFGFHESMITTTMVAGRLLMWDSKILTLDVEEISRKAMEVSQSTWKRYQNLSNS
ncbi:MAG: putative aminohydrolase SsnA [Chloroflexi bacterium]|nr:putative aminohydrolase SsnA [Chloroflexota bacterium]